MKSIFGGTTFLIALGYLLSIWYKNSIVINNTLTTIYIETLILPLVLSVFAGLINARLWYSINKDLGQSHDFSKSYWAWSVARIYRYIPGKVIAYYIRNKLQSTSTKVGVKASISEFILILLPLIPLLLAYFILNQPSFWLSSFFLASFLIIYFIKPITVRLPHSGIFLLLKKQKLYSPKENNNKLKYIISAMILHGFSFYFIIKYSLNQNTITFFQAIISLYISGIIGQLSLISPGGLGVREAAIVVILISFGLTHEISFVAAIFSRVILLLSEIANVAIAFIWRKLNK